VAVVLLLTVVSLAIGLIGEVFIRHALVAQVDVQLQDAYNRSQHGPGGPGFGNHNPYCANNNLLPALPPGLGQGAVGINDGRGVVLDESACPQRLDPSQAAALANAPPDGKPHTVSVPHLGDYEVISNGDNLIEIRDAAIAVAYAVEAIRLFDHYHFRDKLQKSTKAQPLMLEDFNIKEHWWKPYYTMGDMKQRDRALFAQE